MIFEDALAALLVHEGGFVNDSRDPGGMTNLGVTKAVWENWVGHPVTEQDMRDLTPALVSPLYQRKYWISGLPSGIDYVVFDAAVNSGPGRAVKWLQTVVGAVADGAMGPNTLKAVAAYPADKLIEDYQALRLAFLQSLPTWNAFGNGWSNRVAEVKQTALTFA